MIHVTTTTATAQASAMKEVCCAHCGGLYHYQYTAMGRGKALGMSVMYIHDPFARDRAHQAAERSAGSRARRGFGIRGCPHCRRIQGNMLPILRRQFLRQYEFLGRLIPGGLMVACLGTALLTTNFFDDALHGAPAVAVGVTAIGAIIFFVQFGAKPWLTAQKFSVDFFGPVTIPVGVEGPAPIIGETATATPPLQSTRAADDPAHGIYGPSVEDIE